MRNRAKCRLCGDIIESFHRNDYVTCQCDEISIDGGDHMFRCGAKDFKNFIRIDDLDNERLVKFEQEEPEEIKDLLPVKPTKPELIEMLDNMITNIESLPPRALNSSVTHYDLLASLILIASILKAE